MKLAKQLTLVLGLAVVISHSAGAAGVARIQGKGPDGDTNYFRVLCSDNKVGSATVTTDPAKICGTPRGGERRCEESWTLEAAAQYVCR
jgi:hypothetical protein